MTVLVRTRTVLRYMQPSAVITDTAVYRQEGDERDYRMGIPGDVYRDLGEPELITVTIEAGDLLNEASDG